MISWIDGKPVHARDGESILDAARRVGIPIAALCHDPRVKPSATCRLCLVKIKGAVAPVASCAHKLETGMEVTTRDPELEGWRKGILSLILSENPAGECLKCRREGLCQLHRLAKQYGVERTVEKRSTSGFPALDPNPFIARDYSQCILCYRCTRVCAELEQANAIAPAGRGFATRISAGFEDLLLESSCTFCGQCVQTCPTGALLNRKIPATTHAKDVKRVRTICPFCGTGCGLELLVANGRVVGSSPDPTSPASHGSLCVKGQFGLDFVHSRDRLKSPLIRDTRSAERIGNSGIGPFREASWDEAYNLVASRFSRIREESGPDAFALWSSSRSTTESNYLMQKLARGVLGTNNIDNCART